MGAPNGGAHQLRPPVPDGTLLGMLRCRHTLIPLAIALLAAGCPTVDNPCDSDRFGCENSTEGFAVDPACTLTGELQVELGQGETAYEALPAGQMPRLYHGTQGGVHVFMGLRVLNAALDHYDKLKTRFAFYLVKPCGIHDGGVPLDPEKTADDDSCRFLQRSRNLILGTQQPIRTTGDGTVEEFGILIRTSEDASYPRQLELQVDDPCGRRGFDIHDVP